jgi:hypothetical protein
MLVFAERSDGTPPEQVVSSSGVTEFEIGLDGKPALLKEPTVEFVDDGPGKPAGINRAQAQDRNRSFCPILGSFRNRVDADQQPCWKPFRRAAHGTTKAILDTDAAPSIPPYAGPRERC